MQNEFVYHSTYKGCNIFWDTLHGYNLKWSAYCIDGRVCANTLLGLKRLITATIKNGGKYAK